MKETVCENCRNTKKHADWDECAAHSENYMSLDGCWQFKPFTKFNHPDLTEIAHVEYSDAECGREK